MGKLPDIELVIADADDTIWRAYQPWAVCIEPAFRDYVEELKVDPDLLRHIVQNVAPGEYRFNNFGSLTHFLRHNEELFPKLADKQADYDRQIIQRNIRRRFFHHWNDLTTFHEGALDTFKHLKASGTATAVWTDSDAPSAIRRAYFSSRNAGLEPQHDAQGALSLIDSWYVMPSLQCDSHTLWDVDPDFIHGIKKKMNISANPKNWKPFTERGIAIMEDFGVAPEKTLMIGDSYKDVQSALDCGMHAAWYKPGANLDPKTVELLRTHASPRYKYGLDVVEAELAVVTKGRPYVTIHESMSELAQHFTFVPAVSAYRHSPLSRELHIPLGSASRDQVGARSRPELYAQFGIATHLKTEPPVIAPQDPNGMAGLEKLNPQVAIQPAAAPV